MKKNLVLGIDFGTSNSLVGAWRDGQRVEALRLDPFATDPTLTANHGQFVYESKTQ